MARLLVIVVALVTACGGGKKPRKRSGDAGPSVVYVDGDAGTASELPAETEPNDAPEEAQALTLPAKVSGTIGMAGDKDRFAVEVPAPGGHLTVQVSGGKTADLVVDLLDDRGKAVVVSDNGPAGTIEGLPNYPVEPGRYVLVVREFVKKKQKQREEPSGTYELQAQVVPPGAVASGADAGPEDGGEAEVEPNDEPAFAGELPLGGAGHGYLGWKKDRDVWKVSLATAGEDEALKVDVAGLPKLALRVSVLDGTGAVLQERQGKAGEAVTLLNVAVREGEPHYYVRVATAAKGDVVEEYVVKVATTPFALDEEEEPNDAPKTASALSEVADADAGTRVGFLSRGDVDVFRIEPSPVARRLTVSVEPPPGVDAELSVVGQNGKPVAGGGPENKKRGGGVERLADVTLAAGAPAFVRLVVKGAGSDADRYRLRWSTVPAPETTSPEDNGTDPGPIPGIDDE